MTCKYVAQNTRQEYLQGFRAYRTATHGEETKKIIAQIIPHDGCTKRAQRLSMIMEALMLNTSEHSIIWWLGYFDSLVDDVFGDHD